MPVLELYYTYRSIASYPAYRQSNHMLVQRFITAIL